MCSSDLDELGLREAAVTVRDEDIVIEVPGEDESTFKEIRDIISQTARLEFKMLDDSTDFFGATARTVKEEDFPKGVSLNNAEQASVGRVHGAAAHARHHAHVLEARIGGAGQDEVADGSALARHAQHLERGSEIGRASCRDRV